jgi:small conductance mechanosensitive channel
VLLASTGVALSQDKPVGKLDDAALLDLGQSVAKRLADAEAALEPEKAALASGQEALAAKRAEAANVRVPDDAPLDGSTSDAARASLERLDRRLDGLRTRQRLAQEEKTALEERAKRLDTAGAAAGRVGAALDAAGPAAAELDNRVSSGRIAPDKVPPGFAPARLAARRATLAAQVSAWSDDADQNRRSLGALPATLEDLRRKVSAAEAREALAARALVEAQKREAVAKEIDGKDPRTISGLLAASVLERERLEQALEPARVALERARADVARVTSELATTAAPNPDAVKVEPGPARVVAAERTYELSRAMADYHARRAEGLERSRVALAATADLAPALAASALALDAGLLRTSVLAASVERLVADGKLPREPLPSKAAPDDVAAARRRVAAMVETAGAVAEEARARLAQLPKEVADETAAGALEQGRLKALGDATAAARENARWTQEVETFALPELVKRFSAARESWKLDELAAARARAELDSALAAVESASLALRTIEDPLARRARAQNPSERKKILDALYRKLGLDPPHDDPGPSTASAADPAPATLSPGATLLAALEDRETVLAGRIRVVDDGIRELDAFKTTVIDAEIRSDALVRIMAETLEASQRTYGAALELQARVGLGTVAASALPPGVNEAASYDRILTFEGAVAAATREQAALHERRLRAEANRDFQVVARTRMAEAFAVAGKRIDALKERAQLEATADRPLSSLPDTERKRREQEIGRSLDANDWTTERVLAVFGTERTDSLTDLLRSYYGDVLELERKRRNLASRTALTSTVLALADEERRSEASLLPVARENAVSGRAAEAAERIRVGLVPPTDPTALAALRAAGRPVPAPQGLGPDDLSAEADRIFEARARVLAADERVREIELHLSQRGADADAGVLQDELGALAARSASIEREIERLGARPSLIHVGDSAADALAVTDGADGEIVQIRALRRAAFRRAALLSIAHLILIPLIAVFLVQVVRKVGVRFVKRVAASSRPAAMDRAQRAETIRQVASAALIVTIVVVATLSVLRELHFDVTPILASAGVVGLAIAFGAQALVRDLFNGTFILLENQYMIGDTVKIGDLSGVIEKVTLRLTVVRAGDGTLHFIPNGNILQVSNRTKGWAKEFLAVSVGYGEDLGGVLGVLRAVSQDMSQDELYGPKLLEPPEVLGIDQFSESGLTITVSIRTLPGEVQNVAREARLRIKRAFDAAKISMAVPQGFVQHPAGDGDPPDGSTAGPDKG